MGIKVNSSLSSVKVTAFFVFVVSCLMSEKAILKTMLNSRMHNLNRSETAKQVEIKLFKKQQNYKGED